jgi:hypothetical protein
MTPRTALNPISSAAQSICSAGTADTIVLDLIVLRRRGLLRHARVLVLTPLHWFRLSLAAWRALFQLLYDPQRWEKTEHGLAKSSRLAGTLDAAPTATRCARGLWRRLRRSDR